MSVLDGPLEQTECLENENLDFSQINPLGYLGRRFGRECRLGRSASGADLGLENENFDLNQTNSDKNGRF